MALKELTREIGEQLSFTAFELAEKVSSLLRTEAQKKSANEDYNDVIKKLKKEIALLAVQIEAGRK